MASRNLNLNIEADTSRLKADLADLSVQIGKLATVGSSFANVFNEALTKAAIAQERLNQAAGQTLIIEERLNQAAIKTAADRVKADNAAIVGREKLNQAAAATLVAEEKVAKAATDRLLAEQRLEQQAKKFADQQSDRAKRTTEELKRTAAAAEQANKIQNEGAGGLLRGLQSNLFAINNLRFGIQSFAFIVQGAFSTILEQATTLESQILGLTGAFASLNTVKIGGQVVSDVTEKIESIEPAIKAAISQVREISLSIAGVTSSQLVDVFQTIAQNSAQANLSIKDSVGLVKSFSAGLVSANIPLFQQRQEIQSILTAQINQDSTLAKQLGITNELVKRYQSQGKLVQFLNERLEGSVEIQKRFSKIISGALSNVKELAENVQAAFGGVLLQPLADGINEIYDFLFANKSQIEGFFVAIASGLLDIGSKLRQLFDASVPLLGEVGKLLLTVAEVVTGVLNAGFTAFVSTTQLLVQLLSSALVPVLQLLNSDLGKIAVTAGVLVTILNAALLPAIKKTINFLLLTVSGIVAAIAKIGALIVAYSAETVAVTTLSGAYAQLAAAKVIAQGASGGLSAVTAALSGGVATLAISAAAAVGALIFYERQLREANDAAEALRISTQGEASDSLALIKSLKKIQDQRKIDGTLSEENRRKELVYIETSKKQVEFNNKQIQSLRELANADQSRRPQLESQIKLLEQLNGQLSQLQTEGLAVTKIGAAYTFLAEQVANAIKDIKAGVNEVKFDQKSKELLDLTAQQLEANLITRKQGVEQLNFVALNEDSKVEVRLKAQKQVLKLLEEQGKEEIALLKAQGDQAISLVADGQLSEIDGLKQSASLKKQQLDLQLKNLDDFYSQQQAFVAKNEAATFKALQENLAKAKQASADANTSGDRVKIAETIRFENQAREQLLLAEKNFQNQKLILSQEFQTKDLALKAEARKADREAIQQQVAALRSGLDRELSANADLRKKAEQATQADILALKIGGFESDRQLEEQSLLQKQRNIESELFDKRRVLEFDKTNLANFVGSQKEKEELILKIGNQEAEIAKLNLEATDNLIARNKLLYEQKINNLEIEKTTTDRVTKLLESQNSLLNAQIKLYGAIADARLKGAENQLTALKEADSILKGNRDKANAEEQKRRDAQRAQILSGLNEEKRKKQELLFAEEDAALEQQKAAKDGAIAREKERLTRERLAALGISAGTNELAIARQIFDQEQRILELKARRFEQDQASARRELEISIQQSQIRDKQLLLEGKIALTRARASGSADAIRDALELNALLEGQVANNKQIGDIQRQTLATTQGAELATFNQEQQGAQFKNKIAGAESGLVGLQSSDGVVARSLALNPEAIAKEAEARKKLADAKDPAKVRAIQGQRKQDLASVADGAVAFENTSQQIADNFASLPNSLKATKDGLKEVIAQSKELAENPVIKSREQQAAKQQAAKQQQAEQTQITNRLDGGLIEIKTGAEAQELIKREQARREKDKQEAIAYRKRLGFFTGGLPPVGEPVTVNERGQEAVTNLQNLETSLLPNGERTVQFDAPTWVHNASETKQLGSLGVFDSNQLPNINFGAIASALRINNAELLAEMKLQNSLLSQLADGIKRPNMINNFNNVERPDLQIYRLQNQLLRT